MTLFEHALCTNVKSDDAGQRWKSACGGLKVGENCDMKD